MAQAAEALSIDYEAPIKDLYEMGEIPPMGHVPANMYAWAIRRERHGEPDTAMQVEVVPTHKIDSHEVLVLVMAAGVNYNGVWASLGIPISPFDVHKARFPYRGFGCIGHRLGRRLQGDALEGRRRGRDSLQPGRRRRRGMQRRRSDVLDQPAHLGLRNARWQLRPVLPRPGPAVDARRRHLTWEEAACYTLTLATAYRMLFGHRPHVLRPGHNVLVWGASGGLGSLRRAACSRPQAPTPSASSATTTSADFVMSLGAKGVINRNDFDCWGRLPEVSDTEGYGAYMKKCRAFGKAIWQYTGKGNDVDIVFEHPGEATFPVSCFVVKRGGMVVFCAGTTGYNITFDARFVWMRQKRIQGSHFANLAQASQANKLVIERRIDPCMSEVFSWEDIPRAHMKMRANEHKPGNMAVLVQSPRPGLRTLEDVLEG